MNNAKVKFPFCQKSLKICIYLIWTKRTYIFSNFTDYGNPGCIESEWCVACLIWTKRAKNPECTFFNFTDYWNGGSIESERSVACLQLFWRMYTFVVKIHFMFLSSSADKSYYNKSGSFWLLIYAGIDDHHLLTVVHLILYW